MFYLLNIQKGCKEDMQTLPLGTPLGLWLGFLLHASTEYPALHTLNYGISGCTHCCVLKLDSSKFLDLSIMAVVTYIVKQHGCWTSVFGTLRSVVCNLTALLVANKTWQDSASELHQDLALSNSSFLLCITYDLIYYSVELSFPQH